MATTTLFKPSTDNFGHLTLHATILGDGIVTPEVHKARIHTLSLILFALTLIAAVIVLFVADKAAFAHHDTPVATSPYSAWMIDTN